MRRFPLWLILTLAVLFAEAIYAGNDAPSPKLQLAVRDTTGNDSSGDKAYAATLTNTTPQPIRVELIDIPKGDFGGGVFYPCAVQFWNSNEKQWHTIPPRNTRAEHGPGFFSYWDMKPDETLEVCRTVLAKERIKGGRCARFAYT